MGPISPGRKLPRLRSFSIGLTQAIMNKPLPAPPERYDLVESFDALLWQAKSPLRRGSQTHHLDPSSRPSEHLCRWFRSGAAGVECHTHQPPSPGPPVGQQPEPGTAAQAEAKASSVTSAAFEMDIHAADTRPAAGKQSFTMQYALQSLRSDTPTKPAPAPMLFELSKGTRHSWQGRFRCRFG